MSQIKRKSLPVDGTNKRFHVTLLCFILLNCCIHPTQAASASSSKASTSEVIQTHSHINEPATYQAQLPSTHDVIDKEPAPLPTSSQVTSAIVQRLAPNFEADAVVNGEFTRVKLSDYKGKYVVLLFYPHDFSFVCPTELIAFGARLGEFHAINADVIAVSVDSKYSHLAWTNLARNQGGIGKLSLPLVSDITKTISKDYGVLVAEGPDAGASLRALFIISNKGAIRQATINDMPVGRSVDETLRLVKAFQFADENDVVCPVGWQPGSDTIKANPVQSLDYFQKHS